MSNQGVVITETGSYVPSRIVTNQEISARLELSEDWIEKKTGIIERRYVGPTEATSDLAAHAALAALDKSGIDVLDIDMIVVGTSTPDYPQPGTALLVQQKIGASRAFCVDINLVCASFVYAVEVTRSLLMSRPESQIALVIGADTYSRVLNHEDKRTCVLFGDGAGAVILRKCAHNHLEPALLESEGDKWGLISIPAGGSREPINNDNLSAKRHLFHMEGRNVADFVRDRVPKFFRQLLHRHGLTEQALDHVIFHQANYRLLEECRQSLGIPQEKFHYSLHHFGNTGAASIPITLDLVRKTDRFRKGDKMILLAFGGGMSIAGTSLTCNFGETGNESATPFHDVTPHREVEFEEEHPQAA